MDWRGIWNDLQHGYVAFPLPSGNGYFAIHLWLIAAVLLLVIGLATVAAFSVANFTKKQRR